MTFGGGWGMPEQLLFEACFINHYYIKFEKLANFSIGFSPEVNIRMKFAHSFPIINPSYKPEGSFNFKLKKGKGLQFIDLSIGHHSNGQEDHFYDWENQQINFESGNFMTNYIGVGHHFINDSERFSNTQYYRRLSIEYHPDVGRNPEMSERYDDLRLHTDFKWINLQGSNLPLVVATEFTWRLENLKNQDFLSARYLDVKVDISIQPLKKSDFWFFAQYYKGEDYYHLYFVRQLHTFRFGIVARNNHRGIFNSK